MIQKYSILYLAINTSLIQRIDNSFSDELGNKSRKLIKSYDQQEQRKRDGKTELEKMLHLKKAFFKVGQLQY